MNSVQANVVITPDITGYNPYTVSVDLLPIYNDVIYLCIHSNLGLATLRMRAKS